MTEGQFAGLRALAGCGGCAAKAPTELVERLTALAAAAAGDPARAALVGLAPSDDAAVYPLAPDRALVATVDFFPPIVDDPDDFGAIAAANAVSDVYAMGGEVAFALAVSGFPEVVPDDVIASVLRAAAGVVAECGGAILGGHTVRCREPVFGLCVLGFVRPSRIWRKGGARPGDVLVLSKPLGTGLLISSGDAAALQTVTAAMRRTNRAAAAALGALAGGPAAVTDVSGYGLSGHALEIARSSGVRLCIESGRLPLLDGALAAAAAGTRTRAHRATRRAGDAAALSFDDGVDAALRAIVDDPQTSGGLLAAVAPAEAAQLQHRGFVRVGTVQAGTCAVHVA